MSLSDNSVQRKLNNCFWLCDKKLTKSKTRVSGNNDKEVMPLKRKILALVALALTAIGSLAFSSDKFNSNEYGLSQPMLCGNSCCGNCGGK